MFSAREHLYKQERHFLEQHRLSLNVGEFCREEEINLANGGTLAVERTVRVPHGYIEHSPEVEVTFEPPHPIYGKSHTFREHGLMHDSAAGQNVVWRLIDQVSASAYEHDVEIARIVEDFGGVAVSDQAIILPTQSTHHPFTEL